ncbi:uncharacterized protein V6R79_006603 [Siganus canaliculatus]
MDPADLHLVQDQFSCSICLEVFNKPVSTPCGHNYCKDCLASYWAASGVSQCPLCKQSFQGVPELRVNNDFRDLLEVFRKTRTDRSVPATSGHGVVTCDLCDPALKHEALKSCLVCLASYCGAHLEPHRSVQALKWHKLIQPTSDLEGRVCRKHSRVVEFFCRDDRSSVCAECLQVDHASHHAVSLEDEFDLKRTTAKTLQQQLQHTLVLKGSTAEEVQTSVVQGRRDVKKTKAEVKRVFAALASRGAQLVQALEEKQEAMERRAQALSHQLQLEIADHQRAKTELEELWTTEDDFRLLRELPSVSTSDSAARVLPPLNLHGVRSAVARMEEVLGEQVENISREIRLAGSPEDAATDATTDDQTEAAFDDELGMIQKTFSTSVTLDPDSAHPCLLVSADRKQVRDGGWKRKVVDHPNRFDFYHFVLGDQGFSSGRFYYEVVLKGQTGWEVGLAREGATRKGVDLSLGPSDGFWTLGRYWGRCQANANPPVVLPLVDAPERVGVFVNYEDGLVSFYDVDRRTLIFSFQKCAFTVTQTSMFGMKAFTWTRPNSRIYPLFRPTAGGKHALRISPVRTTKE